MILLAKVLITNCQNCQLGQSPEKSANRTFQAVVELSENAVNRDLGLDAATSAAW